MDASGTGIGTALVQTDKDNQTTGVIAYGSRHLSSAEQIIQRREKKPLLLYGRLPKNVGLM